MNHLKLFLIKLNLGLFTFLALAFLPPKIPGFQELLIQFWGKTTAWILSLFFLSSDYQIHNSWVIINETPCLEIVFSCTGWKALSLFLGLSIILSSSLTSYLGKISFGIVLLFLFQALRLVSLSWIWLEFQSVFEFFHDHFFYLSEYGLILWLSLENNLQKSLFTHQKIMASFQPNRHPR